jgi:DNA-directed RNA polymerase III subunit RPC3
MVKAVLEKRERTDIMEDESLLTAFEKTVLEEWEKKQTRLTALEMRVEESVFVLRDLTVNGLADD